MNVGSVASGVLAVAGTSMLVCSVSRVRAAIVRPTAVRFGLAAALVAYAVALLIDVGPVTRVLDLDVFGRNDLTILVSQALTTATAWCGVEMVIASAERSNARGFRLRLAITIGCVAWQCATFVLPSAAPQELSVVDFYLHTRAQADWQLYWVSYGVISGAGSIYLGLSSARYARHASMWLRRGMWSISVGSALCAGFSASIAASTVVELPAVAGLVQTLTVATGTTLIGFGCVIPQIPDLRARRTLMPLWRSVTDLYPAVRLTESRPDLRRVVTEIQDAVATARYRDEVASPLMRELSRLSGRPADEYELSVNELCGVARMDLSPWWDDDQAGVDLPLGTSTNGER